MYPMGTAAGRCQFIADSEEVANAVHVEHVEDKHHVIFGCPESTSSRKRVPDNPSCKGSVVSVDLFPISQIAIMLRDVSLISLRSK